MSKLYFTFSILFCVLSLATAQEEDPAVNKFREYLRINSAHPTPNYESCVSWLRNQSLELGLEFNYEAYDLPHSFATWMTWRGSDPSLKSILMDSHMDVVAADPEKWEHHPFEAYKDAEGNIFGRGTTDMKSTTVATLEAIRRLKASGFVPLRTIHIIVLPDEELYSRGVKDFVNSTSFSNMNVGFALDEGTISSQAGDEILVTYAEKSVWQFNYTVRGKSAHSSTLPEMTAGQKIQVVIDRLMEFRASQLELLTQPGITIQNITTLNLVKLGGGLGNNIIPDELWASFDMRIITKPGWELNDVEELLNNIAATSGNDTSIDYLVKAMDSAQTPTDSSNVWWLVLVQACSQLNTSCIPNIPSGVTDGRYIRNTGIPLFGLSPFPNVTPLAHQDNEHINEASFLAGISRFETIIKNFASVSGAVSP